jgi:UDP-N-acetyl-D-galactosamine dehydrogenase
VRHPSGAPVRIGIIGLGYVGLPLAVEFGKRYPVVGFDLKARRVAELRAGRDVTQETSRAELKAATGLVFTTDPKALGRCNVFIVTVPTPVDAFKRPDFDPLVGASTTVGRALRTGGVVIYESTVYPGGDRRGLRADPGTRVGPTFQPRFLRRLQPRAHQSG